MVLKSKRYGILSFNGDCRDYSVGYSMGTSGQMPDPLGASAGFIIKQSLPL